MMTDGNKYTAFGTECKAASSVESYAHKAAKDVLAGWLADCGEAVMQEFPVSRSGEELHCPWWNIQPSGAPAPSFTKLAVTGNRPAVIFDIAMGSQGGAVLCAFEIVHRNGISKRKRALLEQWGVETFVMSAGWVLSQVKRPAFFRVVDVVSPNPHSPIKVKF